MADKDTDQGRKTSGCIGRMQEMMRNMMSKIGDSCCSCGEKKMEQMSACCSTQTEKEGPVEKQGENAPS